MKYNKYTRHETDGIMAINRANREVAYFNKSAKSIQIELKDTPIDEWEECLNWLHKVAVDYFTKNRRCLIVHADCETKAVYVIRKEKDSNKYHLIETDQENAKQQTFSEEELTEIQKQLPTINIQKVWEMNDENE